jgi:hypothetical protein
MDPPVWHPHSPPGTALAVSQHAKKELPYGSRLRLLVPAAIRILFAFSKVLW